MVLMTSYMFMVQCNYETHVSIGLFIFSGFNDLLCLTMKLCAVVAMVTVLDFFIQFFFINSLDSDARDKDFKNTFIILSHVKICPAMMVTKKRRKKKELCRGSRHRQARNILPCNNSNNSHLVS